MRLLEVLFLIIALISIFIDVKKLKKISLILFCIVVLHIVLEGVRWQIIPGFFAYLLNCLRLLKPKKILSVISFILMMFSLILGILLPVYKNPEPSGSYSVGTKFYNFRDESRDETFTDDPNDRRDVFVQVWYPSNAASGRPLRLWNGGYGEEIARINKLPGFVLSHLKHVKSNSYLNAEILNKQIKYPVLIFSHGYLSVTMQNSILMEELASNGFVIFSIAHPYESALINQNGRTVKSLNMHKIFKETDYISMVKNVNKNVGNNNYFKDLYLDTKAERESINIWTRDSQFVLDKLSSLNSSDFKGLLDLENIGAFGHSLGGMTAVELSLYDSRIKAAINLDGLQLGESAIKESVKTPLMMIVSDKNPDINDFVLNRTVNRSYKVVIADTEHNSFTDFSYIVPYLNIPGLTGTISHKRVLDITNSYIKAFFENYLKSEDSALLSETETIFNEAVLYIY